MVTVLITVKISKGFKTWTEMAKSFEDEMPADRKNAFAAMNANATDTAAKTRPSKAKFSKWMKTIAMQT